MVMKYKFDTEEILKAISNAPDANLKVVHNVTLQKAIAGQFIRLKPYLKICKALNMTPRLDSATK